MEIENHAVNPSLPGLGESEPDYPSPILGLWAVLISIEHFMGEPLRLVIDTAATKAIAIDEHLIEQNDYWVGVFEEHEETMKGLEAQVDNLEPDPDNYDESLGKDDEGYRDYLDPTSPTYNPDYVYEDALAMLNTEMSVAQAQFDADEMVSAAMEQVLTQISSGRLDDIPTFIKVEKDLVETIQMLTSAIVMNFHLSNSLANATIKQI